MDPWGEGPRGTLCLMRIALVVTDSKGKNVSFITETFKKISLKNLLVLVEKGRLDYLHNVRGKRGKYVRSDPNRARDDNLDVRSIPYHRLLRAKDDLEMILGQAEFQLYWKLYSAYLRRIQETEKIITVDGFLWTPERIIIDKISKQRVHILRAAAAFSIDPNLLGAIVIDECARFSGLDLVDDPRALIGKNTTVGIAQIRVDTAKELIIRGYYNPNPRDPLLEKERITTTPPGHLYTYLIKPHHSIHFAAARIQYLIDRWVPFADISKRVDIIGTVYSLPDNRAKPRKNPESSDRGRQIKDEFYPLAKKVLQRP